MKRLICGFYLACNNIPRPPGNLSVRTPVRPKNMRRIFPLFTVLLLSAVIAAAQPAQIGKEINDRDIEWADFTAPIDPSSRFDAWTDWRITYSYPAPVVRDGKVYVTVSTKLFLRYDSWVKPDKKSRRLLEHEQGHFRIGRLCAREIRRVINSTPFSLDNYPKEIDAIYWAVINKYVEINKQYDRETDHYNNVDGQARWNKKLSELLER